MSYLNFVFKTNSPPSICDASPSLSKKRGGTSASGRGGEYFKSTTLNCSYCLLFAGAFVFVWLSCSKNSDEALEQSDLVIKTGTVCGWCSKNDTLIISGKSFKYVNYIQCSTANPSVKKIGKIEAAELESLIAKLDFSEFKKLDLNSCNVCVDGCDDWITITKGTEIHHIRFGSSEPKLQTIKEFIDGLNTLKSKYSGN